jgi:hypothetical protein
LKTHMKKNCAVKVVHNAALSKRTTDFSQFLLHGIQRTSIGASGRKKCQDWSGFFCGGAGGDVGGGGGGDATTFFGDGVGDIWLSKNMRSGDWCMLLTLDAKGILREAF